LETLTREGGFEYLVERIKSHVFHRAEEEAKELLGQAKRQVGSYPDSPKNPC
jgi:hypothetical protein